MRIVTFGITHKNSTIALRERAAFSKSKIEEAYGLLEQSLIVEEAVILSTCNRSEIFAAVSNTEEAEDWFCQFYSSFFGIDKDQIKEYHSFKKGTEAVTYLYQVCCGLDSLVIGEDQILGQVKEAHQGAMKRKMSGKVLNKLFLEAVSKAKEIKTKTSISENPLSISSIAVKQIERKWNKNIKEARVMVIGFGEMSRLAIENLLSKNVKTLYICNRTQDPIDSLVMSHNNVKYIHYEKKYEYINEVDVIISATSAPHLVLTYQELSKVYRGDKPLIMVDIALPRDIDPLAGDIEGITLINIDDLKEISNENLSYRMKCREEIEEYIDENVSKYKEWYHCIPLHPRIEAIKQYSSQLTDQELQKLFKKLNHMDQRDRELIEIVVKSLVKKMWRRPILQLKSAGERGRGEQAANFVDELFGFEKRHSK